MRSIVAARARDPNTDESEYTRSVRKVQDAIGTIQKCNAEMQKEAGLLSTAQSYTPAKWNAKVVMQAARAATSDAKQILQSLSSNKEASISEQSSQRLTQQKLSESLLMVSSELEAGWQAYQAADGLRATRTHTGNADGTGSIFSVTPSVPASGEAGKEDLEAGHSSVELQRIQSFDPVSQAEVDMHTAIVTEYTEQVSVVASNMREMRRALLDLADHARMQGAVVETIERNMATAADSTSGAVKQVVVSNQSQQKTMKRFWWILLFALLLAIATIAAAAWKR